MQPSGERVAPFAPPMRRRTRRTLVAAFGACCGCFVALASLVAHAAIEGRFPEPTNVNILMYLLTLAFGTMGAAWAVWRYAEPRRPEWLMLGLAAWLLTFPLVARASVYAHENVAVTLFLSGAGLFVIDRAFVAQAVSGGETRRYVPRLAARSAFLLVLLASLAGAYVVERRARSRAEEVYDHFQEVLASGQWAGLWLPREEVTRLLRERFGLEAEAAHDDDRCTWHGVVNAYQVVFRYHSNNGVLGCKNIALIPVPRWE